MAQPSNVDVDAKEFRIHTPRGATRVLELTLKNRETGIVIDLTGDTVKLTGHMTELGGTQIFAKSNAPGAHSAPTDGKTQFTLLDTDTLTTCPAGYASRIVCSVEWIGASGAKDVAGSIILEVSAHPRPTA